MTDKTGQKQYMVRYLLGQMSEEERADFEKQYLANEELFEELVAAEAETVRSYLQGSGSEAEREKFDRHYLTAPSRRRHVEFEKSLAEYVSQHAPAQAARADQEIKGDKSHASASMASALPNVGSRPGLQSAVGSVKSGLYLWRFAAVVAVLLLLLGGSWLVLVNRRLNHEIQQLHLEQSQREQEEQQLHQQVADLDAQLQQQRKVTNDQQQIIAQLQSPDLAGTPFTFSPGLVRRVDQQTAIVIPRGLSLIPLQLRLERDEYLRYAVSLETPEGDRVWQQQNLASLKSKHQHVIALKVPAKLLQSRTYILIVTGTAADGTTEEVAAYTFRVLKQ